MASEKSVKEARRAVVAQAIAGGEPGSEWSPPAESARLRTRAVEVGEKLQVYQLAGSIHDADSVWPARLEALRLAQVGLVRDHFAPAVAAMLAPLAEFARAREAVVRMLDELGTAGLDGGPVSMPHFPFYAFGPGCDFPDAVRRFVREVADSGSITAADSAALAGG